MTSLRAVWEKWQKKNKARLNFILKPDSDNTEKEEHETNEKNWTKLVPNYMRRIVSKRIKRKIGHRVGEETMELLEEVAE
jgi:hypothetical protein